MKQSKKNFIKINEKIEEKKSKKMEEKKFLDPNQKYNKKAKRKNQN